jgi:hypothetical protein
MPDHPGSADPLVPDWFVEQLAAGALPPDEASRIRALLEARGELARLEAIEVANQAFLAAHPVELSVAEIRRRAGTTPSVAPARRPARWLRLAAPLAAAAAVLSIWFVRQSPTDAPPVEAPEQVHLKGLRPHLAVYRKSSSGSERLGAREHVRPGDSIQLAYVAAGRRFGVIASVDARGSVTLHLPEEPGLASKLTRDRETSVPHSFVVDDAKFERFVFVTADHAFSTDVVVDLLRSRGGTWPSDLSISELTLEKAVP